MQNRPEIHFWHIPKTAGTSVAGVIRRAYPPGECIPAHTVRELVAMRAADVPNYRCYTGHFFSLLEPMVGRQLPTVTILRDPVEQTLSLLRHCQRYAPGAGLLSPLVARFLPLVWENFPSRRPSIEKRWCPFIMNNFQTRVLGSDIAMPRKLDRNFYGMTYPFLEPSFCSPDADLETLYARAVARLESMTVVGTVERLRESVDMIFRLLGLAPPAELPHENVSKPASHQFGVALRELIEDQNSYDFRLHKHATRLLDRHIAASRGS